MARPSCTSSRAPGLLLLTSVLLLGCSGMLAEPAPQVETAALRDPAGDAVIATLHTKDSELRITSSGGNVRYSLLDPSGTSKSLTLEELQSYDRNLYEFVKNVTAGRGMPTLDARIPPAPPTSSAVGADSLEADRHRATPPAR